MNILTAKWPFVVNAFMLALLVMLGLYLFDDTLGLAKAFNDLSGYAEKAVEKGGVPDSPPPLNWLVGILAGVLIGGISGGLLNGSWKFAIAFEEEKQFGWKLLKTAIFGVASGFLIMLGSLLAGEVFFGQFAAAMQLSPGAWLFLITALLCGGVTALFAERRQTGGGEGGKK